MFVTKDQQKTLNLLFTKITHKIKLILGQNFKFLVQFKSQNIRKYDKTNNSNFK